jgi:hypothetical protein
MFKAREAVGELRCGRGPELFRASGTRGQDRPLGCRKSSLLRQVASLAWKKLAGPAPRLKKLVALRHAQRSKAVDPERSGLAPHRAEIPECRLDPGHSVFWDLGVGPGFCGRGRQRR